MPLLDMRAVIFIALGQSTSAIRDLEDVVAEAQLPEIACSTWPALLRRRAARRRPVLLAACARRGIKAGPRRSLEMPAYESLAREMAP